MSGRYGPAPNNARPQHADRTATALRRRYHRSPAAGVLLVAAIAAVLAVACNADDDGADPTPAARVIATRARPDATSTIAAAGETPASGAVVEVTGIVGAVSTAARAIEINRISGANVNRIELAPATTIRSATGGRLALQDIRPSERIIASGPLNERGDAIVAREITVQNVVPGGQGSQPGG